MSVRYTHTNLIAKDWKQLAEFYIEVFGCKQKHATSLFGEYLEKGIGIKGAALEGVTLELPGYESPMPMLEIFQYAESFHKALPITPNREGYGHIAFQVDSVEEILQKVIEHGGTKVGEIVSKEYEKGISTYIYTADPEGNIVELQNWNSK
jgi:predicted enzyme related to lactoylglutathione lyase